jgi:Oxidoreductase family, NAD-binding Rossmann fold
MAVTRGFGIVGTGVIAAIHADAIAMLSQTGMADARLVAVTDVTPGAATAFAAARGCPAEASLDALLARRDVEVVCVPHRQDPGRRTRRGWAQTAPVRPHRRRMARSATPNNMSTMMPRIKITMMIVVALSMSAWSW